MRTAFWAAALALAGCAEPRASSTEPLIRVQIADIALNTAAGRAVLRERVASAARQYCELHGDAVTPYAYRNVPYYCPGIVRNDIVGSMTREARSAYGRAYREARLKGWQL
jgi:UrcA family protein